jgi:hypothetical protein
VADGRVYNRDMAEVAWEDGPAELKDDSLQEWEGQATSGILELHGPCPRCHHTFTFPVHSTGITVTATAAADSSGDQAKATFNAATLIKCLCGEPHAHPPKMSVRGCGAYWVARPKKDQAANKYTLEPVKEPKLIAAATLVAKEGATAAAGLKTLAEKWIPGIAAIISVLGLSGLVISKDAIQGLSQEWRGGAFALVAVAVIAAVVATVWVYRAAFGWPTEIPLGTDDEVLAAAEKLSKNNSAIVTRLRGAVSSSVVAVTALLLALAIFWLQPDSTRPTEVTYTGDTGEASVCGKLGKVSNGELQIKIEDGSTSSTKKVELSTVTALEQVDSCGG